MTRKRILLAILIVAIAASILPTAMSSPEDKKYFIVDDRIRGPKGIENIIYRVMPKETWHSLFWEKKVAMMAPEPDELERARSDPNILIIRGMPDIGSLGGLWFNCKRSPTKFHGFRKAVGHLIDWNWVKNTVWKPGNILRPVIYPAGGSEDWVNTTCTFPEYSEELALKALEDDGFKKSDGKWIDPEGKEVETIIIIAPSYSTERMEVAKALGKALEKLGFSIRYEFHGWSECEKMTYYDKNYHIFFNYPSFDAINLPTAYKNLFHSKSYAPPGTLCQNYMGVEDPVLDKLIDELAKAKTWEEAKAITMKIEGRIWEKAYAYMIPTGGGGYTVVRLDMYTGWYTKRDLLGGIIKPLVLKPVKEEYKTWLTSENENGGKDWFVSFNPLQWTEALYENAYFKYVYMPLFYVQYGPDVKTDFVAGIAYAYKMEDTDKGTKFTFYLFPNATWHDGKPVTAEDVKFTFDFMCKEQKHANRLYLPLKAIYDHSEVVDEHTVVVYTKSKSIWQMFAFTTAWILPKHIWANLSDPQAFENYPPIGCGPFKVKEWVSREYLHLVKHDGYHLRWISPEERQRQEVEAKFAKELKALSEKISTLDSQVKDLSAKLSDLQKTVDSLSSTVSSVSSSIGTATGLAILSLLVAIVALIKGFMKPKLKEEE